MQIIGHQHILELLPKLSAQTLLFTGPEGVGRRTVAQWWALGLNCERGFPACGSCASCRLSRRGGSGWQGPSVSQPEPPYTGDHPDYLVVAPETETKSGRKARQQQIRLEQIAPREEGESSLLDWLSTYPRFKAKVGVIDSAHLLNESAANALLKVLEEPPSYARLVLIAPSRELVLPTLVSRSMEIAFGPLPETALHPLTRDPQILAFAEGAVGRVRWALENPAEFGKLTSRAEGVLEALGTGPSQTLEAIKLLNELDGGLAYLGRELTRLFAPEDPRRSEALQTLAQTQEALTAYVGEELALTWLGLRLAQLESPHPV